MYSIEIRDLQIDTVIGVYDWERLINQRLVLDVVLQCDDTPLASDEVADVIDYKQVCDDITSICHAVKAQLIEHLGAQIIERLFADYPCHKIDLRITKPNALRNATVGVHICRERP